MSTSNVGDKSLSVEMLMTTLPLETVNASDNVFDLAKKMKETGRGSVVVTEYTTTTTNAGSKTGHCAGGDNY